MTQQQMTIEQALQLAWKFHQAGQLGEAESIYRQVLAAFPALPQAMHLLGILSFQTGKKGEAIELLGRCVQTNPESAELRFDFAQVLSGSGKTDEAIVQYQESLRFKPDNPVTHNNLGNALLFTGRFDQAIESYQQAVTLKPDFAEAHNNLGNAYRARNQLDQAIAAYRQALAIQPQLAEAHYNLGIAHRLKGNVEDAIADFRQAIQLRDDHVEAWNNLGNVLRETDKIPEAIDAYRQVLNRQPNHVLAHNNLGISLLAAGRIDDAIASQRRAIELQPDWALAHYHLGLLLLMRGDYREGWKEFEHRINAPELEPLVERFPQPRWSGDDLKGRRILLHTEQGFCRFDPVARIATLVAERGGKVIIRCQKELVRLLRTVRGAGEVISNQDPLPQFDVQCPLLSLPLVLDTTLETIPFAVSYLSADPEMSSRWRGRLPTKTHKVGLVWAGSIDPDSRRSASLAVFEPFAQIDGVSFISLQKGDGAEQARQPPEGMKLIDWSNELTDFADTAALIDNLDLVVTVDTAVAHLAAAMGKPVWMLLPFVSPWRWMQNRSDSPWYPTMRLFRQPSIGDWGPPVQQVAEELRRYAHA